MKIEKESTIFNRLESVFVFLTKKAFSGYWENRDYIKKNSISDGFNNELKDINQKRTRYAIFFMFLVLAVALTGDLLPSDVWTESQRKNYFILDIAFFCTLLIYLFVILVKNKHLRSREVQNFITHSLIVALIIWSTAVSSIESMQLNYFATYIITIIAISFFFHLRSIIHLIYLFFGFFLLKFHYSAL